MIREGDATSMRSAIIYCPHLDRDIRGILNAVPNPFIFTGAKTERGEDGCLQSHQALIKEAKSNGWPALFVMEDDCMFTKHFNFDKWCNDAAWAEAQGYGCMVGGCVHTYDEQLVREGMIAVSKFHSAHCIVYFAAGYDAALRAVQPYDLSLGEVGCKPVMVYPFVAVQRPSFSGILNGDVNYLPLYENHELALRKRLKV